MSYDTSLKKEKGMCVKGSLSQLNCATGMNYIKLKNNYICGIEQAEFQNEEIITALDLNSPRIPSENITKLHIE